MSTKFYLSFLLAIFIVSGCSTQPEVIKASYIDCNPPTTRIISALKTCAPKEDKQTQSEMEGWLTMELIDYQNCLDRKNL